MVLKKIAQCLPSGIMQFLNEHTSKYQKRSQHFVCTRLPGMPPVPPDYANEIINADILEILNKTSNADPNTNYNILHDSIERAKDAHLPDRIVQFKKT